VSAPRPASCLLALALLACGPGLEEGPPRDAAIAAAERGRPERAARELAVVADRAAPDAWACREHFATNYDHVAQGRATICGGHACAVGSGDDLGLYNTAVGSYLRETRKGYYEAGRCP
jgi:hypothetical protein